MNDMSRVWMRKRTIDGPVLTDSLLLVPELVRIAVTLRVELSRAVRPRQIFDPIHQNELNQFGSPQLRSQEKGLKHI